ncbi:MAG: HAMP domain-containing protein [Alphaproteobacteria bacterium]|nr:HAMP domain-containing protein [Alphaproteobacteria bacterium]
MNLAPPEPRGILRSVMPRGLFARSLIIIIAPVVLLQIVVTYLFFERHFDVTTTRLSRSVASNIGTLVRLHERFGAILPVDAVAETASETPGMTLIFLPEESLPTGASDSGFLYDVLSRELRYQIRHPFWLNSNFNNDYVDIRIKLREGVLRVIVERKYVVATNVHIFIGWMIVSAFVLLGVSVAFLRGQIRPILRLAKVAEQFGKGREVPSFRPSGASEVRAAGAAFIDMRDRISRHLQQRTDMLAGISHDLRTPLTRMKLQLAMMGGPEIEDMKGDVLEMEHMLDEYLEFVRGEGGEPASSTDVTELMEEIADAARRHSPHPEAIETRIEPGVKAFIRRNAIKRCIDNLLENAIKYGSRTRVSMIAEDGAILIAIEDDGPGIPPELHEEVFRPFRRLDAARNLDKPGVGLGLAIARDIARGHGGDIALSKSDWGGLRAELRIPV